MKEKNFAAYVLFILLVIFCHHSQAIAVEQKLKLTFSGAVNLKCGYIQNIKEHNPRKLQLDLPINIKLEKTDASGDKYGSLVKLHPYTGPRCTTPFYLLEQLMLFTERSWGKLEIGSYAGAARVMKVNGLTFASSSGYESSYWLVPLELENSCHCMGQLCEMLILYAPDLWTNAATHMKMKTGGSKSFKYLRPKYNKHDTFKVNYISPKVAGCRLGLTYIPSIASHRGKSVYAHVLQSSFIYATQLKQVNLKVGLSAEYARPRLSNIYLWEQNFQTEMQNYAPSVRNTEAKLNDLFAWEAGLNIAYRGFTLGASYGSWGKSGVWQSTSSTAADKFTYYTTFGIKYKIGGIGANLTYFDSVKSTAKTQGYFNKIALAMDYKFAWNALSYMELAFFNIKHSSAISGYTAIIGAKVKF